MTITTNKELIKNQKKSPVERQRRNLLKGIGATGALLTLPTIGHSAVSRFSKNTEQTQRNRLPYSSNTTQDINLEFTDAGVSNVDSELVRVTLSNSSGKTIELKNVAPGGVTLNGMMYDLNTTLSKGSIKVEPNGIKHIYISPQPYSNTGSIQTDEQSDSTLISMSVVEQKFNRSTRQTQMAHVIS